MGVKLLAVGARRRVALASPLARSADYLESRRGPDGGVAEPGGRADAGPDRLDDPGAAGRSAATPDQLARARATSARRPPAEDVDADALVRALALGDERSCSTRLEAERPPGRADRAARQLDGLERARAPRRRAARPAARRPLPPRTPAAERRLALDPRRCSRTRTTRRPSSRRSGRGRARPRRSARRSRSSAASRRRDGGFRLVPGRAARRAVDGLGDPGPSSPPDAKPPARPRSATSRALRRARRQLPLLERYAVTPVWVTAQVLPALAGKPFPLR